jgi:hypothetical protein
MPPIKKSKSRDANRIPAGLLRRVFVSITYAAAALVVFCQSIQMSDGLMAQI